MLQELLQKNRSVRRFDRAVALSKEIMEKIAGVLPLCASTKNLQPYKVLLSWQEAANELLFKSVRHWGAAIRDWSGPTETEKPTGYAVICADLTICPKPCQIDIGILAQSMTLQATEMGLAGCMLLSFLPERLQQDFSLPGHLLPVLMIAFGAPAQTVVLEKVRENTAYYWDEDRVQHVPKRSLEEVLIRTETQKEG